MTLAARAAPTSRAARSRSGSSASSAASTCSAATPALEVVADQRVAGAAGGELLRPRAGEALVVHVADPLERLERLLPLGRPDPALLEPRGRAPRLVLVAVSADARSACSTASGCSGTAALRAPGYAAEAASSCSCSGSSTSSTTE